MLKVRTKVATSCGDIPSTVPADPGTWPGRRSRAASIATVSGVSAGSWKNLASISTCVAARAEGVFAAGGASSDDDASLEPEARGAAGLAPIPTAEQPASTSAATVSAAPAVRRLDGLRSRSGSTMPRIRFSRVDGSAIDTAAPGCERPAMALAPASSSSA